MTSVQSLQTALAAEHAAVYVYGVLGGRTSASAYPVLFNAVSAAYGVHLERRDRLTAAITEQGESPVAAEPAYDTPPGLDGPSRIAAAALATERACATTYSWLVANQTGTWRRWAVDALQDAATRELELGGRPETFPGATDLA